jgi:long-chain acyl-CoA synthetase
VFVYGNSYKSSLIGVIVPEDTTLFEWAKQNNMELNLKELCKNEEVKKMILKDVTQLGKSGGLKGFEQVMFPF